MKSKKITLKMYCAQLTDAKGVMSRNWFSAPSMAAALEYGRQLKSALNAQSMIIIAELAPVKFINVLPLRVLPRGGRKVA